MGVTYCLCFLFFQQYEWLIGSQHNQIELAKSDWVAIRKPPPCAIDSWGLGKFYFAPFLHGCLIISCMIFLLGMPIVMFSSSWNSAFHVVYILF